MAARTCGDFAVRSWRAAPRQRQACCCGPRWPKLASSRTRLETRNLPNTPKADADTGRGTMPPPLRSSPLPLALALLRGRAAAACAMRSPDEHEPRPPIQVAALAGCPSRRIQTGRMALCRVL